ncbi:hypothetical protein CAPTEDRAFT_185273 [Capitella teleta]|uniref:G-protein coupled receptors family 1 profile domain-containing protein n=1 Tax=Capitella teleta TaxID=283909 RepID=R7TBE0_CAPTE|nr:hypothetical protein CAPTEDRAFT_185273 [Capitella teleta]|eukprot:ELT88329.1 hypothetical protein CAPTEDRAFT_185273 [Capitella teleta]
MGRARDLKSWSLIFCYVLFEVITHSKGVMDAITETLPSLNSSGSLNFTFLNFTCAESVLLTSVLGFRRYANLIVVPLLVTVGLVGNVLIIVVVSGNHVPFGFPSTKLFVRVLALADIFYLLGSPFFQTLRTLHYDTTWIPKSQLFPLIYPFVWPYMASVQTLETWLMVAITADRYVAVSRPFKSVFLCTAKRAAIQVGAISVASAAFNIPHWLEFKTKLEFNACTGRLQNEVMDTALFRNSTYLISYWSVMTLLFRFALPLGILCVLTSKLISTVRAAAITRSELVVQSGTSSAEGQITRVLLSVVVLFLLCESTEFVMHILLTLRWVWPAYAKFEDIGVQASFNTVGNVALVLSASANFIMYLVFMKKFRVQCIAIVRCGKQKNYADGTTVSVVQMASSATSTSEI